MLAMLWHKARSLIFLFKKIAFFYLQSHLSIQIAMQSPSIAIRFDLRLVILNSWLNEMLANF